MQNPVRHFLLALQFFTRIPVTGKLANWVGYSPSLLRASAGYFPAIGMLVGAVSAASYYLSVQLLPQQEGHFFVAAVLACMASASLTGAFHEDGLADLADALGGYVSREKSLEIMKDSRIGSYGALALILVLSLKLALLSMLAHLGLSMVLLVIFLAHVVSRFLPLLIIWKLPHIGDSAHSKSKPLADAISNTALLVALCWCALCIVGVALIAGWNFVSVLVGGVCLSVLMLSWMLRMLRRRLGGFTGDALGATQQLCEVGFYFGVLVAWRWV